MLVMVHIRRWAKAIRLPLLLAFLSAYFAFHLVNGDRGIRAWVQITNDLERAEQSLERIAAERARLEHRVGLLDPESLHPDMIDEQARRLLNFGHPDDKVIITGCVDSTSNFVEHPELVSDRICRYAEVVGRERVMAGTDCGFGTLVGHVNVEAHVAWAKLESLVHGAELASRRLW